MSSSEVMPAARWRGPGRIELVELPVPEPRDDEALVEVAWVGLCGSDVEEWLRGPVVARPGVVLGHEISGTVARAARDGSGPPAGTRVVVDVVTGCGRCGHCREGEEGRCAELVVTGQQVDGGLARYVVGRATRLVTVPDALPLRNAALAEPAAVAVRAVRRASVGPGTSLVVIGGGVIGALVLQVARDAGAHPVIVVEPDPGRHGLLERFGGVPVWRDDAEELRRAVVDLLPERGADAVVECAGRPGTVATAVALARPGGRVVLLGVTAERESFGSLDVVLHEKTVIGSSAHRWDLDVAPAVRLLAEDRIDAEPLISGEVALADVADAFDRLDRGADAWKLLVRVA